jgi:hypothetical protein
LRPELLFLQELRERLAASTLAQCVEARIAADTGRKIWSAGLSQRSHQRISTFVTDLAVKIATSVVQPTIAIRHTCRRRTFNGLCGAETTNICRINLARIFPPDAVGEIIVLSHALRFACTLMIPPLTSIRPPRAYQADSAISHCQQRNYRMMEPLAEVAVIDFADADPPRNRLQMQTVLTTILPAES